MGEELNPDCYVVVYAVDDEQSVEYAKKCLRWLTSSNSLAGKSSILVGKFPRWQQARQSRRFRSRQPGKPRSEANHVNPLPVKPCCHRLAKRIRSVAVALDARPDLAVEFGAKFTETSPG